MPDNYVSKFNINDKELIIKDSEARNTANTASTNATNALNRVTDYKELLLHKTNELNSRISTIIADGQQTEGNTELIDIRTAWNGTKYSTAGDAVRGQATQAVKCVNTGLTPENYTSYFTDADNAPLNQIFFINDKITQEHIAHLPIYGNSSMLYVIAYSSTDNHGFVQYFIDNVTGNIWTRAERGYGDKYYFTDWAQLETVDDAARALRASNVFITLENYTSYFTDADTAPLNQIFFISNKITQEHIAHLPIYGNSSMLYAIAYNLNFNHRFVQYFIDNVTGNIWTRAERGYEDNYYFTDWAQLETVDDAARALRASNVFITPKNYTSYFTDANNAPLNQIFFINNKITQEHIAHLPIYGNSSMLYVIAYNLNYNHGFVQYFIDNVTGNIWTRAERGSGDNYFFTDWAKIQTGEFSNKKLLSENTVSILQKVVCCGDSYTSGHINLGAEASRTNENFAWPHFLGLLTGNQYINCGKSGANVLTWQTDPRGLPAAQLAGKSQAYIIGLGLNDTAQGTDRFVELGTPADIGTDAQTYYGGLSKIIRELNAISPLAKIFVQTMPNPNTIRKQYNNAIRTIVSNYKNTYPVFLLDLTQYNELYNIPSITGDSISGHYTAIGYQQFAEILKIAISDCINNNINDFQNVYLIPTE